jgi:hypothetical protein
MLRSKIAAGLLFQSRFEGTFPVSEAWTLLPEPPGPYPVSLEFVGATAFRSRLFSSWSATLTPYSIMMEGLYASFA